MTEHQHHAGRSPLVRFLPFLLFVALAGAFLYGLFGLDPRGLPPAMVGKTMPEFSAPGLNDEAPLTSAMLRNGEPSVLNVFASWCPPCRVEHPRLGELASLGVAPVYGLAYKDDPDNTRDFLDELGDPYARVGIDRKGRTGIEFGVAGVPETFVIDGAGTIVYKHFGPINPGDLERFILPAIEKASAP